ncbi:MAG: hypothetical protein QNJ68_00680 [Microcoleaceae cyanobacterium MO_207.B10]|nr:hypothetical protein [Microcoleaceae cyanobacterium MO_207.B10]
MIISSILKTVKQINISRVELGLGALVAVASILVFVLKLVTKATIKSVVKFSDSSKEKITEARKNLEYLIAEVNAEKMTAVQPVKVYVKIKTTEK